MTIVLPIFFAAVGFGLFTRKMTPKLWALLCLVIGLVLIYNFVKPPKPLTAGAPSAQSGGG